MSRIGRIHDAYLDPDNYLNQEGPCEVCGKDVALCECPECPGCHEIGRPECHVSAGIFGGCANKLDLAIDSKERAEWEARLDDYPEPE